MTVIVAICVAVVSAVSIYLILGRELKGIAMGVFLLGHAANLSLLAMSRSPIVNHTDAGPASKDGIEFAPAAFKAPPVLTSHAPVHEPLSHIVDPMPQALILTAIVIGFGVMGFLLTLIVVTSRSAQTIEIGELAGPPPELENAKA